MKSELVDWTYPSLYSKIPYLFLKIKLNQQLKASEIRDLQNKKLRVLVKHNYDHVPYYHSLFKKANLTPNDIKTVEDIKRIPISKKVDMINLPIENLTANNIDLRKCTFQRTSGTSGIPFTIYRYKQNLMTAALGHYLWQLKCGDKITNKRVFLGGFGIIPPSRFIQKLGIFRTKAISPFDHPKTMLKEIRDYRTKTLISPPSNVQALSKEVRESNYKGIDLSFIFTGGEFLHEKLRTFISETFEANVFQCYGSKEVGPISRECSEHRLHLWDPVFVETTRDGETLSAGEEGEITVTNLDYYVQPIIRYNLEDLGIMLDDECTCRSHYPLMKLTSGRISELIYLPDGRVTSAQQVNIGLTLMPDIKQFQVIQETINRLTVKLVKGQDFNDNTIAKVKQMFNQRLDNEVKIEVSVVDDIPREKSGKIKQFKTNILTKL